MSVAKPRFVTARQQHGCDTRHDYPVPCLGIIQPGEQYVRLVRFPDDINASSAPWVMRMCETCRRNRWPLSQPDGALDPAAPEAVAR